MSRREGPEALGFDAQEQRWESERRAEKRRRTIASAAVAVVLAVGLGAAVFGLGAFGSPEAGEVLDAWTATASAASEMRELTDTAGRTVSVPAEPTSIAVMDSFCGELAVMLGAGPRVAGLPSGVMSDAILQDIYPELTQRPVGLSGNAVNIETLAQLGCDVALVKPTMGADELAKLDKVGIPYLVIGYETFAEQMAALRLVGAACGADAAAKAEELASFYEQTAGLVEERAVQVPEEGRLRVYHAINDILTTDSDRSLGADWIALTGCDDVSAEASPTSGTDYTATLEQVYAWNPDLVICNVAATAAGLADDAKWRALPAVAAGQVRAIPIGATRWGQRGSVETALAMLWLGKEAYPELYEEIDMESYVRGYYQELLGVEVSDELYAKIMSGEGVRTGGGSGNGQGGGGA